MDGIKLKPVMVEWLDAQSSLENWYVPDLKQMSIEDLAITQSCGFLFSEDKDKLILVFMLYGDSHVKHHQIIPKGMVKKVHYLNEKIKGRKD